MGRKLRRGFISELCQFFDNGVRSLFYRLVKLSSTRRFSLVRFHFRQFTANKFSKSSSVSPRRHRGGEIAEVGMAAVPPSFGNPSSIINFTTAEISAVNRLMRERIQLPEQLNQISPEFYLLADGGANIHIDSSDTLLANSRESTQFINGFGTEMHSSSTLEGHLFGGSFGYSIENGKWGQYLLNSGDSNLLIVPDSKRIFSLSCLRRQGHFILETGPNPGFIVMPQKIYFPFKEADNGLLYFPILPSPVKIDNVYSHFYRQGRLDVLNLQERASEVYQVNSGVKSSDGRRQKEKKNTARKATRSALSKSDFRSKFNRAKALIRSRRKKRTIDGRKRHKVTTHKSGHSTSDSVKRGGLLRRNQSRVLEKIHRKCGHVDMRRMIQFKKEGRVLAKHLPVKFLRKHRKNCPICLIAKRRRNPRPSSLNEDKSLLASWEHTFCDTSGKFRLRSRQGNYYYTVFVDSKTGEKLLFPHRKKKHFPLVFLQFVARIGMYPKKLFSDKAGEIESSTFGKLILVRGVESITVPKGEHYSNPLAEKAIQDLDKMLKAILLDSGIPHDCWDIVVQHCALINSMTSPSLLDPSKTIFEVVNGVIPDLDALPLVGCLAVRLEEKSFRVDQKLDAMNQPGVFVGFANLRNTYGSVILTDKTLIVAGHQVAYDESTLPYVQKSKSDSRQSYINWLLGRVQHTQVSPVNDNALAQHSSQDSPLVGPSESFAELFETHIDIDSSDDEQVDSVIAGMTDEQKSIPAFNTFHPKLPDKHMYLPRKVRGGLQDDGVLQATVNPRRSKRGRSAPTAAEYRPSKSVKLSKPKAKPKGPPITESSLRDNKTLLIGKQLMMHFPHYGGARGSVVNFDSEKQTYELHFPEGDKTWIERIDVGGYHSMRLF